MTNLNDISHDYNHINLVIKLARQIAKKEGMTNERDLFHIIMGALLHDVGDSKYTIIKQSIIIFDYLKRFYNLSNYDKREIIKISSNVSLSKDIDNNYNKRNLKLYIVQDADRINSLGSIGIMRYTAYNIINSNKPSFDDIIANMITRTNKIKQFIKTKSGKEFAKQHFKLTTYFINNYKKNKK
jgi:uncharacterized protein